MKMLLPLFVLFLLCGFAAPGASALEVNYWPVFTGQLDQEERIHSWQSIGPIVFGERGGEQNVHGVRPFFVRFSEPERERSSFHVLYPLFNARYRPYGTSWDVLNLVRFQSFSGPGQEQPNRTFHLFPILFWGSHPDPDRSYFGIFPLAGQMHNLLTYDEITWFLFPLATRLVRGEVTTFGMPWPFIRLVRGPKTRGFHLWPLYGQVARENDFHHRYWLWPLGYHVRRELWKEEPFETFGFLPFYAYSSSDRAVSKSYLWPFFGYTDSQDPEYYERRYFWPLFVQRRGASYINRWAPFYTHSIRSGTDKKWILWPIHRRATWEERGLLNERTQVLFFLYWSHTQSSVDRPEAAPAVKKHLWPFYSSWDNGAGRRQVQALSVLDVFFPFNEVVRANYSPLFAIYQLDKEEGVRSRRSFLFNLITWNRLVKEDRVRLDVGPLFSYEGHPGGRQWEVLKGLLSYSREGKDRSFGGLWLNPPSREDDEPSGPEESAGANLEP